MALRYYVLEGRRAVEVDASTDAGLLRWVRWFEKADRRVAHDALPLATVSTVFLGMDFSFLGLGHRPLIFETMIFAHPALRGDAFRWNDQWRTSTWEEAEAMHAQVMAELLAQHQEAAG